MVNQCDCQFVNKSVWCVYRGAFKFKLHAYSWCKWYKILETRITWLAEYNKEFYALMSSQCLILLPCYKASEYEPKQSIGGQTSSLSSQHTNIDVCHDRLIQVESWSTSLTSSSGWISHKFILPSLPPVTNMWFWEDKKLLEAWPTISQVVLRYKLFVMFSPRGCQENYPRFWDREGLTGIKPQKLQTNHLGMIDKI